jgi:alpha-L-rhamnosidase
MGANKYSLILIFITSMLSVTYSSDGQSFSSEEFENPPIQYWPRPLWFWNNTEVTAEGVTNLMEAMRDKCGYGGFGVVPFGKDFRPEYLSEDYLDLYGKMLAKAKELGMTISLYDEFGFPSGSVGAFAEGDNTPRFQEKFPGQTIERLDKSEEIITGPVAYEKKIPEGKLMGVVAMDSSRKRRINITGSVSGGLLKWNVPSGTWRVMIFTCVIDGVPIADYLNPEAVRNFTTMVHDVYYRRFKEYFGTVIYGTFFDEPSMFHAGFRMWTADFNEKFNKKYGFSPVNLYPAMWYDIGPGTESARNYLFGFRAELYALGFNKVVNDWSVAHGITATGHTAPEEVLVPVNSAGDLMKSFKYLEIPGIDKIGGHRPAERFYKLVSSSAYNWDKNLVMSETYGAMPDYEKPGDLTWNQIDSIAMDQYTKGINMLIPHAVWYDNTKVTYKPELSYRNPLYADGLMYFTRFLARLNFIMQKSGRHVADIAVLYPIYTLQGDHYFYDQTGPANVDGPVDTANTFYKNAVKKIDYINVANWLTNDAGKDYTFLHPEVFDEKCTIRDGRLHLENQTNKEDYSVLIVPSCKTIKIASLKKIFDFYIMGGTVIFTTQLPSKSFEPAKDSEVTKLVRTIFPLGESDDGSVKSSQRNGKACFIASPEGPKIRDALQKYVDNFDVDYPFISSLQYIHKVIDGRNIYYFANIGGSPVSTLVNLRGKMNLEEWDPHTGQIMNVNAEPGISDAADLYFTSVKLDLIPYHSCFLIEIRKDK